MVKPYALQDATLDMTVIKRNPLELVGLRVSSALLLVLTVNEMAT